MAKLQLTLACGDYEIMRPLAEGAVEAEGIDLTVLRRDRARILQSARRDECDMAEFNIVAYFCDSESDPDLFALPVFPHRRFRLGFVFVNTGAGIREPADLIGKTVAVRGERPAAVIWMRGILNEHFGVPYDSVRYLDPMGMLAGQDAGAGSGRAPRRRVDEMLLAGEIDAFLSPGLPPAFLAGDPRIGRLFPDFEQRDREYYEKTGIFPIMHAVTIRRSLLERAPWAAPNLLRAFEESKRLAYERNRNPRAMPLAFFQRAWEDQRSLLGSDPWRYGLNEETRPNLATVLRYAGEQGLLQRERSVDELFVDIDESQLERFEDV